MFTEDQARKAGYEIVRDDLQGSQNSRWCIQCAEDEFGQSSEGFSSKEQALDFLKVSLDNSYPYLETTYYYD